MAKNFTELAYTEAVREAQKHFGAEELNQRIASQDKPATLGAGELEFIQTREDFFLASHASNGWPYVQYKGGPKGFLKVLDERTLAFADYRGNQQYISTGNLMSNHKALLFLVNYPTQQRMKIWVEAQVLDANKFPDILRQVHDHSYQAKVEKIILMKVEAFDWNCTSHITPRFTIDELKQIFQENPTIKEAFLRDLEE